MQPINSGVVYFCVNLIYDARAIVGTWASSCNSTRFRAPILHLNIGYHCRTFTRCRQGVNNCFLESIQIVRNSISVTCAIVLCHYLHNILTIQNEGPKWSVRFFSPLLLDILIRLRHNSFTEATVIFLVTRARIIDSIVIVNAMAMYDM